MKNRVISLLMASLLLVLSVIVAPFYKAVAVFSNFDSSQWEKADWANGSVFNCVWKPSQVTFSNGKMILTLDREYGGSKIIFRIRLL